MTRLHARAMLDYPFSAPATDGSVVEVASGILWVRMPMPMALDHINIYLLRGDDGWTLIDTGLNTELTRERWEQIAANHLQGLPVVRLVCTHMHYDHAGLASWHHRRPAGRGVRLARMAIGHGAGASRWAQCLHPQLAAGHRCHTPAAEPRQWD